MLICIHGTDFRTFVDMTTPTGTAGTWTEQILADHGNNQPHIKVWTRPVTVAGAQTVTTNDPGGGTGSHQALYVLVGCNAADFIDGIAANIGDSTTAQVAPSVSPVTSDALLICAAQSFNPDAAGYTAPPGMTENTDTLGAFSNMATASQVLSSSGATGTKTFTFAINSNYATISAAFKAEVPPVTGDLAATLPALTSSFNGTASNNATLTATLPALTSSFNGAVSDEGVLAGTLPMLVAAFNGNVTISGTLSGTLPALTADITGIVVTDVAGVLAATLPSLTAHFDGNVEAQFIDAPAIDTFDAVGNAIGFKVTPSRTGPCCTII